MKHALLLLLLGLSGCATAKRALSIPQAIVSTEKGPSVTQSGTVAVPAKASVVTESKTVPLPAGTEIVFNEKLGTVTLHVSQPTTLKTETKTEKAEAPQSFTPPAPPTPTQEADGKVKVWFWLGMVAGVAVGLFGLVRGWDFVMYGGGAVAGACAFAIFVQSHPIVTAVIGVGVALAIAGPYVWHKHLKPREAQ